MNQQKLRILGGIKDPEKGGNFLPSKKSTSDPKVVRRELCKFQVKRLELKCNCHLFTGDRKEINLGVEYKLLKCILNCN